MQRGRWPQVLNPQSLAGRGGATVVAIAACLISLAALTVVELVTRDGLTVGALAAVPVLAAAWLLSPRVASVVVAVAVILRVVELASGQLVAATAAAQLVTIVVIGVAGSAASVAVSRGAAARALSDQLAASRHVLDAALDAVISADSEGRVLFWNRSAEEMFGWTADEAVGRLVVDLVVPEEYREAHNRGVKRFRETGEGTVKGRILRVTARRRDGSTFPVEIAITRGLGDDPVRFAAFIRDVSERTHADTLVRMALREAEAANAAKGEFLSRTSHELRTPLSAVIGFAELLMLEDPREDQRRNLAEILRAGEHLLTMINELLQISGVETRGDAPSLEPVRVADVVDECRALLAHAAARRRITIHTDIVASAATVHADRQWLQQVMLNLLSNAVKYNRDGGAAVVTTRADGAGHVVVSVRDTGPGVARELLPRLFTPFERAGAERTTVPGVGLGLALCRRLVEAMHGSIEADSASGEGFVVDVTLDAAPDVTAGDGAAPPAPPPHGDERRTIVYIEDNLTNVELVERVLARRSAIRVLPAMQGSIGLDLVREERPSMVLLDVHLPDIDGAEVLRRLKADAATRDIPVFMLTADGSERLARRLLDAGAAGCLSKPIPVESLLAAVDSTLSLTAQGGDGR